MCYKCPELSVSGSALFICTDETVRLSSARSQHADNKAKNVRPCRRSEAEALSGRNTALWEFRAQRWREKQLLLFKISHLHSVFLLLFTFMPQIVQRDSFHLCVLHQTLGRAQARRWRKKRSYYSEQSDLLLQLRKISLKDKLRLLLVHIIIAAK